MVVNYKKKHKPLQLLQLLQLVFGAIQPQIYLYIYIFIYIYKYIDIEFHFDFLLPYF